MSEHDQHSTFIKTPQQLITVVLLAFTVHETKKPGLTTRREVVKNKD